MVQCYLTGDGNVSFHKGTLAPPGEYDCTCASFGPLESSPQSKRQMDRFSRFCTAYGRKCFYITMGAPIHQNCPFPWGIWASHVTRDAFGLCEPTTQTVPRSVQPYLHRWPRSVSIVYNAQIECRRLDPQWATMAVYWHSIKVFYVKFDSSYAYHSIKLIKLTTFWQIVLLPGINDAMM